MTDLDLQKQFEQNAKKLDVAYHLLLSFDSIPSKYFYELRKITKIARNEVSNFCIVKPFPDRLGMGELNECGLFRHWAEDQYRRNPARKSAWSHLHCI